MELLLLPLHFLDYKRRWCEEAKKGNSRVEEFNEFMTEHPREYLLQEFILQSVLVGVFRMRFFGSLEVVGEEDFAAASCDLSPTL